MINCILFYKNKEEFLNELNLTDDIRFFSSDKLGK